VDGDNAPEFHDRFSIHPQSVEFCRSILSQMAARSLIPGAQEEVDALSDWEAVQHVERMRKVHVDAAHAMRGLTRAAKGAAARLASLTEQLIPLAAEELANETEMFLAIDHSD
jgi:hypothetical protein